MSVKAIFSKTQLLPTYSSSLNLIHQPYWSSNYRLVSGSSLTSKTRKDSTPPPAQMNEGIFDIWTKIHHESDQTRSLYTLHYIAPRFLFPFGARRPIFGLDLGCSYRNFGTHGFGAPQSHALTRNSPHSFPFSLGFIHPTPISP